MITHLNLTITIKHLFNVKLLVVNQQPVWKRKTCIFSQKINYQNYQLVEIQKHKSTCYLNLIVIRQNNRVWIEYHYSLYKPEYFELVYTDYPKYIIYVQHSHMFIMHI